MTSYNARADAGARQPGTTLLGGACQAGATAEIEDPADPRSHGLSAPAVARALAASSFLFGQLSFEVFGRFEGVAAEGEVLFD